MTILFAVALTLLLWPWVVYPAVTWIVARLKPRHTFGSALGEPPGVSVVIAARDEVAHLERKLDSLAWCGLALLVLLAPALLNGVGMRPALDWRPGVATSEPWRWWSAHQPAATPGTVTASAPRSGMRPRRR